MKVKRFMLALAAVILCLAVIPFSACNDNKKTELQSMKEDMIQYVANYPSEIAYPEIAYPQLMTMFYQDIIDETVEKINAATSKEELFNIQSEFHRFMITKNMAYMSDNLTFELRQDTLEMYYISGTYEDKPYNILWYLRGVLSIPIVSDKTAYYYAEDPELVVKQMVITNNDVSGSEDFQPMTRTNGSTASQEAFPEGTTHYAFIITKGEEVVGITIQRMKFYKTGAFSEADCKFLASGIFETPMTEDQVKNYIQTIIDGKTPSQNNKLIPNNAAYVYYMDVCMQFYAVSQNDMQRIAFNPEDIGDPVTINSVYSDTAFTTDENGAPVNQITLENGDTVEIRADFPGDEYIIVTTSCDIDYNYTGTTNSTFIFQMQPLDKNIYSGSGRQMNLIAACDIHFRLPFVEKTEHDTTFALAVGKYLVNQLKSGVSPENLTIG